MKKSSLSICLILLYLPVLFSQETGLSEVMETEQWLKTAFTKIYESTDDSARDDLNKKIVGRFENILKSEESFYYPWNELNMISKVRSQDEKINIFTWYIEKKQNAFEYFGILQIAPGKRDDQGVTVILLNDESENMKNPETLKLNSGEWFGAMYYGIKSYRYKKTRYYALLGYDFNNPYSRKKLLEILTINKDNEPVFAGTIQMELQKLKRVIFEYSSQVVMSLSYDDKLNMIVLDHLAPSDPILTNNYRFYSPDGSFDAFKFEKGVFILHKDVDARNH